MKIAFRTDASPQIGTGHLSRCMTLADALSARGCNTTFICRDIDALHATQIRGRGHALLSFSTPASPSMPQRGELSHSHWLHVSQTEDAEAILAATEEPWDLVVVDHYALDARWERMMRGRCAKILAIDDLADRIHDCDFLLDQNLQPPGRDQYAELVPSRCTRLVGTQFALLRPEFSHWAREKVRRDNRLNIFFGGIDRGGATLLALQAFTSFPHMTADIVVGGANPHLDAISAICADMQNVHLHVQAANMAELFSKAQLALGAGGATSWERCCVGLPALVVSLAENQLRNCALLDAAGVAVNLGRFEELSAEQCFTAIHDLMKEPLRLDKMGERARSLIDGKGTMRVMDTIMNLAGAMS